MNEIEKLMENAGVEPIDSKYEPMNMVFDKDSIGLTFTREQYLKEIPVYPDFTTEKQLELIKWLGKLAGKLEISSNYNDTQYLLYFYLNRKTRDELLPNLSIGRSENFEESLAGLINSLWQDLTEEEQKQIKEILK